MSTTKNFNSEVIQRVIDGEQVPGFEFVDRIYLSEARWGVNYHYIFTDLGTGKHYRIQHQRATGDSEEQSLVDQWGEEVACHQVVSEEIKTVKWFLA